MPTNPPSPPKETSDKPSEPADKTIAGSKDDESKIEGEGSYTAARRHRESVEDYIESHDVEKDARDAAPDNAKEAQEMADAEKKGKRPARS